MTPSDRRALIESRLRERLDAEHVEVIDESHLHVGHAGAAGGAGHFRALVVSRRFEGLGRVAAQRLVYAALAEEIGPEIHALTIRTLTPEAWRAASRQEGAPAPLKRAALLADAAVMAHDEGCPVPHRLEVRLAELRSRRRRLAIEAPIGVAVSAAAGYMVGIAATAPSNLLVASLAVFALLGPGAVGFLHRLTDLLAADCPSCGELFFYSPERMLFSFPLLHGRCASCDVPLGARFGRRAS